MSWHEVNLTKIDPNLELIPERVFTFELLPGARLNETGEKLLASFAIVNDGEFSGRRITAGYTQEQEKALKRLEQAMGVDATDGEDPVVYLNRAAGGRFSTNVRHSKPTDEYPNPKAFLGIWNVKPAA